MYRCIATLIQLDDVAPFAQHVTLLFGEDTVTQAQALLQRKQQYVGLIARGSTCTVVGCAGWNCCLLMTKCGQGSGRPKSPAVTVMMVCAVLLQKSFGRVGVGDGKLVLAANGWMVGIKTVADIAVATGNYTSRRAAHGHTK